MMPYDDLDLRILDWMDEMATGAAATDAATILSVIDRTAQRTRFTSLRAPFLGVPTEPPLARAWFVVIVAAALLALLAVAGLGIGMRPRVPPPFAPRAVIDVPGVRGAIAVGGAEQGIWIGGDHVAIRVDATSGAQDAIPVPIAPGRWTGLLEHGGVLWAADWLGNRIVRVDTTTGWLLPEITAEAPLAPAWADGVWIASGSGALSRFDPATGRIEEQIQPGPRAFVVVGDALWFVDRFTSRSLVSADPSTGIVTDRIELPFELGGLGGLVEGPAGTVWAWDSGSGGESHVVTVDPASRRVTAFTIPSNLIGGIVRVADRMWAVVGIENAAPGRLQELSAAGPTSRVLPLPPGFDPDTPIVAGDSLWLPSEPTSQVFRYPLDALR